MVKVIKFLRYSLDFLGASIIPNIFSSRLNGLSESFDKISLKCSHTFSAVVQYSMWCCSVWVWLQYVQIEGCCGLDLFMEQFVRQDLFIWLQSVDCILQLTLELCRVCQIFSQSRSFSFFLRTFAHFDSHDLLGFNLFFLIIVQISFAVASFSFRILLVMLVALF